MMATNLLSQVSCPGKVILSGEHSTVYGKNAVATTIDLYTDVQIYAIDESVIRIRLKIFDDFQYSWPLDLFDQVPFLLNQDEKFVFNEEVLTCTKKLLEEFEKESINIYNSCLSFLLLHLSIKQKFSLAKKSFEVIISSSLPVGAGLGSSSSFIVSLTKALLTASNLTISNEEFNQWCFEIDKIFHGKPSGLDNSICSNGGAVLFGNGQIIERIINTDIPSGIHVLLVNTKVPRNTKIMVEKCRQRLRTVSKTGDVLLEALSSISCQVWDCLKNKNLELLPVLFEINQQLLNCLDVSHERIDTIISLAKQHGFAAKLTGAGGGGVVMIYLANNVGKEQSLIDELDLNGFHIYKVRLGVSGVF